MFTTENGLFININTEKGLFRESNPGPLAP
jgi:hypothetical protein